MNRRTLVVKNTPLCLITGPRGGTRPLLMRPNGVLCSGMTEFRPEDIPAQIKSKGERRRVRRALFQKGFRGAASRSLPIVLQSK